MASVVDELHPTLSATLWPGIRPRRHAFRRPTRRASPRASSPSPINMANSLAFTARSPLPLMSPAACDETHREGHVTRRAAPQVDLEYSRLPAAFSLARPLVHWLRQLMSNNHAGFERRHSYVNRQLADGRPLGAGDCTQCDDDDDPDDYDRHCRSPERIGDLTFTDSRWPTSIAGPGWAVPTVGTPSAGAGIAASPRTGVSAAARAGISTAPGTSVRATAGTGVETAAGAGVGTSAGTGVSAAARAGISAAAGTSVGAAAGAGVEAAAGTAVAGTTWPGIADAIGKGGRWRHEQQSEHGHFSLFVHVVLDVESTAAHAMDGIGALGGTGMPANLGRLYAQIIDFYRHIIDYQRQ